MTGSGWLIFALWLALGAYWGIAARGVKRSIGTRWLWWREIAVRLGFFAFVVLALRVATVGSVSPNQWSYAFTTSNLMGLVGLGFCVLGIGLVILGRLYLDRSRGMPVSRKNDTELLTTGPYALVRHPIYGGLMFAMLGSAIGQSIFWLLPLIVYGPYFILSARREERNLTVQFPEDYPAYKKRTKMLLPFVL
jgi:protein-S-isoprenylcysteine O-methyltransferase Ste14